jgi:hypothetical protein
MRQRSILIYKNSHPLNFTDTESADNLAAPYTDCLKKSHLNQNILPETFSMVFLISISTTRFKIVVFSAYYF